MQPNESLTLKKADQLYQQQLYAEAIPFYEKNRRAEGHQLQPLLKEADCLRHLENFDQAESLLTAALVCDENDLAHKTLAEFYLDRRQGDKAQQLYASIYSKYMNDPVLTNRYAVSLDIQGFHTKAQDLYKRALAISPTDINIQGNYGLSLAYLGRFDEAIRILTPLKEQSSKQRHNLAIVYALMHQTSDFHDLLKDDLTTREREEILDKLSKTTVITQ